MPEETSLEKIQEYFTALYANRNVLYHAITQSQVDEAKRYHNNIWGKIKDLYVPLQTENV